MIKTTLIYLITFIISLFFTRIYEKKHNNLNTYKKIGLLILIILPPIILATFRYNVGTDYLSYIQHYFDIIENFSLKFIFIYYSREPLYVITTYISYLLFNNYIGSFFIYSIIFMSFIIGGIIYYKEKLSITVSLAIFYVAYYLVFFNISRQMIALSIIFFGSKYLYEKKMLKYVVCIIIAGLFHKTAYIMIFAYLLTFKLDSSKINKSYYIAVFISILLIYPIIKLIMLFASTLGIFGRIAKINIVWDFKFLLYIIPEFLILFNYRKAILRLDKRNEIFYRLLVLQLPTQIMGVFVKYADRLSIYFGIFQIILVPLILRTKGKENDNKIKSTDVNCNKLISRINDFYLKITYNKNFKVCLILSWYTIYYIAMFIILNSNGVYPYMTIFKL